MYTIQRYREGADYMKSRLGAVKPDVLMILGSGLGSMADLIQDPVYIPYKDVPHMRASTAIGHTGRFAAGYLAGRAALIMQGRLHCYEGYTAHEAAYPVRLAKLLGIESMVVTNAAGGINTQYRPGELMLINDFINFNCSNPLIGPNIEELGPRFPDMSRVFDREYMRLFRASAEEEGDVIREGVYFYASGPQYETPAEIRAMRALGADAVGMSTVPECIAARHAGMRILGVTLITNMASGILDKPLSGEEVVAAGNAASGRLSKHITRFIGRMDNGA